MAGAGRAGRAAGPGRAGPEVGPAAYPGCPAALPGGRAPACTATGCAAIFRLPLCRVLTITSPGPGRVPPPPSGNASRRQRGGRREPEESGPRGGKSGPGGGEGAGRRVGRGGWSRGVREPRSALPAAARRRRGGRSRRGAGSRGGILALERRIERNWWVARGRHGDAPLRKE